MCVCTWIWASMEARRKYHILLNWNCRWHKPPNMVAPVLCKSSMHASWLGSLSSQWKSCFQHNYLGASHLHMLTSFLYMFFSICITQTSILVFLIAHAHFRTFQQGLSWRQRDRNQQYWRGKGGQEPSKARLVVLA